MLHLSSFVGLGVLLFTSAFVVCYFYTGLARPVGMIAIIYQVLRN